MSIPYPAERTARLNMRIAPDALETIREAAIAQQQDITGFALGAAMDRARHRARGARAARWVRRRRAGRRRPRRRGVDDPGIRTAGPRGETQTLSSPR